VVLGQLDEKQSISEIKNLLKTFKDLQKTSPLLQHAEYRFLVGAPPQEKSEYTEGRDQTGGGQTTCYSKKEKGQSSCCGTTG